MTQNHSIAIRLETIALRLEAMFNRQKEKEERNKERLQTAMTYKNDVMD